MHAFVRQLLASCVQPHASRARTSIRSAALAPAPRRDTTAVSLPLIIAQRCSLLCSLWLRARLPGERATLPLQKRRRGAPEVCLDGPMAAEEQPVHWNLKPRSRHLLHKRVLLQWQPVHWNLKPLHRTHGICSTNCFSGAASDACARRTSQAAKPTTRRVVALAAQHLQQLIPPFSQVQQGEPRAAPR